MRINNIILLAFVLISIVFIGCNKETLKPEDIYLRVYDDPNSDRSYYSVDIIELADGGFYVLGATTIDTTRTWLSTYIMRTDKEGKKIWGTIVDKPYMNPVPKLMVSGGDVIFFCLDDNVQGTYVMKIDEAQRSASLVASMPNRVFPLAVSQTPDSGFLLVNYDRITRNSQLSKYNAGFNQSWSVDYGVIENAEHMFVDHLTHTGRQLPFFTGTVGNGSHYYANLLYNYSIGTVFVSSSGGKESIYYGYQYAGGMNAMQPLNETTFALSRFSYNDHFLLPATPLAFSGIAVTEDLGGIRVSEVAPDSENHIILAPVQDKSLLVYAFTTKTNQVTLYFHDPETAEFVGQKVFGFANPVKIKSVKPTQDGGLALLLETHVFGRYRRIALQKVPKDYLKF